MLHVGFEHPTLLMPPNKFSKESWFKTLGSNDCIPLMCKAFDNVWNPKKKNSDIQH